MKPRKLTVSRLQTGTYKKHPFIRLSGKYLQKSDFNVGDKIEVTLETGRIVITKLVTEQNGCV